MQFPGSFAGHTEQSVFACNCWKCSEERGEQFAPVFRVCRECGNKRCPAVSDHKFACTGSNEPGQVGVLRAPPTP